MRHGAARLSLLILRPGNARALRETRQDAGTCPYYELFYHVPPLPFLRGRGERRGERQTVFDRRVETSVGRLVGWFRH